MSHYTTIPNVVFTRFETDGDGVLLNLKTKNYYTLNETAAFIWSHIELGAGVDEISEALIESFEVNRDEAWSAVENLLQDLDEEGLIRLE